MKNFYVYIHLRKKDKIPFYIGKGKGNRAYDKRKRNDKWLKEMKKGYIVKIIKENLNEDEAFKLEAELGLELLEKYPEVMTNNPLGFYSGGNRKFWDENSRKKVSDRMKENNPSKYWSKEKKKEIYRKIEEKKALNKGKVYIPFKPFKKECEFCKNEFLINKSSEKNKKYCSRSCVYKSNSKKESGKNNPFYNKKHSKETKEKWKNRQNGNKNTQAKGNVGYHNRWHKKLNISWDECEECKKLRMMR